MLHSFQRCFVSLGWCFLMVVFVLYIFALVFLRGVITYLDPAMGGDMVDEVDKDADMKAHAAMLRPAKIVAHNARRFQTLSCLSASSSALPKAA